MRKLTLKGSAAVLIFFLVLMAVSAVFVPVYSRLTGALFSQAESAAKSFEQKFGISFSYKSFSPSIITGIRIKNIVLSDLEDGSSVIEIHKAVLRYSFFDLIRGKGLKAVKDLTVDGFIIELDRNGDNILFSRFAEYRKNRVQKSSSENKRPLNLETIENAVSSIPFKVFIKNVHMRYQQSDMFFDGYFRRIAIDLIRESGNMAVKTTGGLKLKRLGKNFSCTFSADGVIPDAVDGASLTFRLADLDYEDYSIRHMNMLLNYSTGIFDARTFQNPYPLFAAISYDVNKKTLAFNLETDSLMPSDIIISRKNDPYMEKARGFSLSSSSLAEFNILQRAFTYASRGKISVPARFFHGGAEVSFDFSGDRDSLAVKEFSASGENVDINYSGSCVYRDLSVSGIFNANLLRLEDGRVFSTEIYFDPGQTGFMAFAPQFMLGEKAFTAVQLTVIPAADFIHFNFELSDYGHETAETPGMIKGSGSYSRREKEIEANITSEQMYLDSIAKAASYAVDGDPVPEFSYLKPFLLNGDLFFSFKQSLNSVTCYIPYIFAVNTEKDGQVLYLSADGSSELMNISRLDYINNGKLVHSQGYMTFSDNGDLAFSIDVNSGSVPYSFSGNYMDGAFSVAGDYGFALSVKNTGKRAFKGSLFMENLPLTLSETIFTLASDCSFGYSPETGIDMQIKRIEFAEAGEKYQFHPRLLFSAIVSRYGFFIDNLVYSDSFSTLEGTSDLLWNLNGNHFSSANLNFAVKNPVSSESLSINLDVSNPDDAPLSLKNVLEQFYFNAQVRFVSFGLNRFIAEHSENNTLTANIIASGSAKNPYIGLEVEPLSLMLAGETMKLSGSAYVEEKILTVEKTGLSYGDVRVKDVAVNFDLNTFTGSANAVLDAIVMKKSVHAPLVLNVSNSLVTEGSFLPSEYTALLSCASVGGDLFCKPFPFSLTLVHGEGITTFFTGEEQGIFGSVTDDLTVNVSAAENKPVQFNLTGSTAGNQLDLKLQNMRVDAAKLLSFMDIPKLKVYNGLIRASVAIKGLKSDPDFSGSVSVENADFMLPTMLSHHVTFPKALMVLYHNNLEMPEIKATVKKDSPVFIKMSIFFDRWRFNYLDAHIRTPKKNYLPANFEIRLAKFTGDAAVDLDLHLEDSYLDVTGNVDLKNMTVNIKTKELTQPPPKRKIFVRADLGVKFGQHVTMLLEPLLRAVLVPDSGFAFKYDMSDTSLSIDGDLSLRSGDVSYLSRSFYIKNGLLRFNKNDPEFNPLISVQAETRERDEDGKEVRIILSANNQYMDNFNPKFSSIPAKSENEIMSMLGQIAVGDSNGVASLLFATGDYAIQSTIGRSIENKLRDFLNFDILSVRTNVIQNALNYNFNRNNDESSSGIGNFFDNSTVYFGKYLGRSLYVDTLMHWSYDKSRVDDEYTIDGLVFRPEIGLELESPFVNIRWNMAPNLSGLRTDNFVYSTSVTLSWKFSL